MSQCPYKVEASVHWCPGRAILEELILGIGRDIVTCDT